MDNTIKTALAVAAMGCSLFVGIAAAAESATPARPNAEQRANRQQQVKERWTKADANHDGALSREEAEQGMPKLAEHFDQLDSNGDGKLTGEELRAAFQARKDKRPQRPAN
jgi:Ca2+-binding EF-hand superfamily protein